jgi:hypothetical protein
VTEPDDEERVESAPEGSSCAVHPERAALVTCPRCGSYCCVACWHDAVKRCHECLLRDPGVRVPWADAERGLAPRFFGTLADAFRPRASAPGFARGSWRAGVSFALLTFLPLALVAGIIPYTHRLGFGPSFSVSFLGGAPSAAALALDVLQAAALGLFVTAVKIALLAAPFLHLVRAYGEPVESGPAAQVLLYRGWLLPLGTLLLGVVVWGLPLEPTEGTLVVTQVVSLLPLLLLLSAMSSTARMAAGVGPIAAVVVVLVPFVLMFLVEPLVHQLLAPWLPDPQSLRDAVSG